MDEKSTQRLTNVAEKLAEHMQQIASYFTADTKITLVIRDANKEDPGHAMILTTDNMRLVTEAIRFKFPDHFKGN